MTLRRQVDTRSVGTVQLLGGRRRRADTSAGVSFRDVLRVPEFRALLFADIQSTAGDSVARVALSVLVFDVTGSTGLTAAAFALTLLPAFIGGVLLSGLADRHPRRAVMLSCDVLRTALVGLMALPVVPVGVACALLVVAVLTGPLFTAARTAVLPQVLTGDAYVVGRGLRTVGTQIAQLTGYALGGIAVAAVGARAGLGIDAATFALSAFIIWRRVRPRPAPEVAAVRPSYLTTVREGISQIASSQALRLLLAFGWLAAFFVVPEGLAAPYAAAVGGGPIAVGLLLMSLPVGAAIGAALVVRVVPPAARVPAIGPLAVASGLILSGCLLHPGLVVSLVLWTASGACSAYQVPAAAEFVLQTRDEHRGTAFGFAASGVIAVQGVGVLVFGGLAEGVGAAVAVGTAGAVATVLAVLLMFASRRAAEQDAPWRPAVPSSSVRW